MVRWRCTTPTNHCYLLLGTHIEFPPRGGRSGRAGSPDDLAASPGGPVLQVVAIDSQHPVVAAQPTILGRQPLPTGQGWRPPPVGSAHAVWCLAAQQSPALCSTTGKTSSRGALLSGGRWAQAPLSRSTVSRWGAAGLRQHGPGIVVWHTADVVVVDL